MGLLFSSTNSASSAMAKSFVSETIASDKVVIFSKSYCPYCTMAKEVNIFDFIVINLRLLYESFCTPTAIQKVTTTIHGC